MVASIAGSREAGTMNRKAVEAGMVAVAIVGSREEACMARLEVAKAEAIKSLVPSCSSFDCFFFIVACTYNIDM